MKNYALVGYFDKATENVIIDLWNELKNKKISDYGFVYEDRVPHITFIDLQAEGDIDLQDILRSVTGQPVEIKINTIGNFIGSKTLFYGIIINKNLRDTHDTLWIMFREYVPYDSIYAKNKWVAHTTIASRLSDEDMLKTFEISKKVEFENSKIEKLVLLEIKENNKVRVVEEIKLRETIDNLEQLPRLLEAFRSNNKN